jgi:copper resistance protein B
VWERAYGGTADLRRDRGEDINGIHLVAGMRFWF